MNPIPFLIMAVSTAVGWLLGGTNGAVAGFAASGAIVVAINAFL